MGKRNTHENTKTSLENERERSSKTNFLIMQKRIRMRDFKPTLELSVTGVTLKPTLKGRQSVSPSSTKRNSLGDSEDLKLSKSIREIAEVRRNAAAANAPQSARLLDLRIRRTIAQQTRRTRAHTYPRRTQRPRVSLVPKSRRGPRIETSL